MGFLDGLGAGAPDLSNWAAEKGLEHHDRDNVVGYSSTLWPDWPDARRNVMSGLLPGGEPGVIFHNVGKSAHRTESAGPFGIFTHRTTAPVRFTRIGAFVPEGIAGLQRFRAPVAAEEPPGWSEIAAEGIGLEGRHFFCSANADATVIERVMKAGLAKRFSALDPDVTPNYRFGVLFFERDGLLAPASIEALCVELAECAAILRSGAPQAVEGALDRDLPAPFWINEADALGREVAAPPSYPQTADQEGVGLDQVLTLSWMALATAIGTSYPEAELAPEDTLSFYRAFPRFPVPGQAVVVAVGRLPGTEIQGRLVLLADNYPDSFNYGFDAFMVDGGDARDTDGAYEESGGLRYAVRDGWACVWRSREETLRPEQIDASTYGELAAQAATLIEQKGWG